MGVVDPVCSTSFSEHPGPKVSLSTQIGTDELQRHHTVNQNVSRSIDNAHTTFADARFEAVSTRDYFSEVSIPGAALNWCGVGWLHAIHQ